MYYTERIQWVRDCKNLTQTEVAQKLGIKQQQYARYEKGINVMPITYLAKLCKILDVSADYIIGLTDEMKPLKNNLKKITN
jgi:transcriptional regulator with XRE-family HTH domain